ncbi:MAG: hypothetical protein CRN43_14075, partial [Candidatus Nephrothrix sp. EaCA]
MLIKNKTAPKLSRRLLFKLNLDRYQYPEWSVMPTDKITRRTTIRKQDMFLFSFISRASVVQFFVINKIAFRFF